MSIPNLIEKLGTKPSEAINTGSVVSIALHSLMVAHNFNLLDSKDKRARSNRPPPGWASVVADSNEWVFKYTRSGSPAKFLLHCSLQEQTGRLFVFACEMDAEGAPAEHNIQRLGLVVENYCTTASFNPPLSSDTIDTNNSNTSKSWDVLIQNTTKLEEMFVQCIVHPLWAAATKTVPRHHYGDGNENARGLLGILPGYFQEEGPGFLLADRKREALLLMGGVAVTGIIAASLLITNRNSHNR
jgi:hypothetical protein